MRRLVLLLTTLACLRFRPRWRKARSRRRFRSRTGSQPEGIAVGKGDTFYVGSIPTGAVYAGSLRTGTGNVLVPGATGHAATGLEVRPRPAVGLRRGDRQGVRLQRPQPARCSNEIQLATSAGPTFINDVVVTGRAAYFTDSNRPVIYKVAKSWHGSPGEP